MPFCAFPRINHHSAHWTSSLHGVPLPQQWVGGPLLIQLGKSSFPGAKKLF